MVKEGKKLTAAEVHQDLYLGQVAPPARSLLAQRQERAQEEHDEKCLVLHLSGGEGAEMAVCHHKYAIEKYVTKNIHVTECNQGMGGYSFKGFSCSAFPSKIANHCFD